MTSPWLTSSGTRWPLSSSLPSPTATTSAVCGFSLAVSGRTMPEGVVSSRSTALTSARSPKGLNCIFRTSLNLRIFTQCFFAEPGASPGFPGLPARDCNRERYLVQLQTELRGELVSGEGADRLLGNLAALEAGDGRDARYAVVHRGRGVVVHVELDEPHVVPLLGHLLEDRGDTPARHAPRRPEVHYDRLLRLQNVVLERRIRYLGNRHGQNLRLSNVFVLRPRYSSTPGVPFCPRASGVKPQPGRASSPAHLEVAGEEVYLHGLGELLGPAGLEEAGA